MSLMTYKDAYPWGESIRTELIAGHMPPWGIESGHANIKNAPDAHGQGAEHPPDMGHRRQSDRKHRTDTRTCRPVSRVAPRNA